MSEGASDTMYHEPIISGACGSVATTRPSEQDQETSMPEASTPIIPSELEPVTPSRLSDYDDDNDQKNFEVRYLLMM